MPKIVLLSGKICSGKTTYANRICEETGAILLSVDELMLPLFGQDAGERHDEYTAKIKDYFRKQSAELAERGVSTVLDWGFWQKSERDFLREFYRAKGIECELHCISVPDEVWKERINARNQAVSEGKSDAYYIDEGLAAKFADLFEMPEDDEVDVWVKD